MNKTVRDASFKHIRKASQSFDRTGSYFRPRPSEKLKTLDSSDIKCESQTKQSEFIVTKRAKLYSKGHSKSIFKDFNEDQNAQTRLSNFDLLKRQAKMLEKSQVMKGRPYSDLSIELNFEKLDNKFEPEKNVQKQTIEKRSERVLTETSSNFIPKQYIVNNEFVSYKKISVLDKCRQNIKKINKNKVMGANQTDRNIIAGNFPEDSDFLSSFISKKVEPCRKADQNRENKEATQEKTFRREHGSSVAKKFYQPSQNSRKSNQLCKTYSQFMHPNLKAKAIQISSRNQKNTDDVVIICL